MGTAAVACTATAVSTAAAAAAAAAQFVSGNLYLSGQFMGLMRNIMIKNGRDFMDALLL